MSGLCPLSAEPTQAALAPSGSLALGPSFCTEAALATAGPGLTGSLAAVRTLQAPPGPLLSSHPTYRVPGVRAQCPHAGRRSPSSSPAAESLTWLPRPELPEAHRALLEQDPAPTMPWVAQGQPEVGHSLGIPFVPTCRPSPNQTKICPLPVASPVQLLSSPNQTVQEPPAHHCSAVWPSSHPPPASGPGAPHLPAPSTFAPAASLHLFRSLLKRSPPGRVPGDHPSLALVLVYSS